MTYNVFGGTLNLTQSVNTTLVLHSKIFYLSDPRNGDVVLKVPLQL